MASTAGTLKDFWREKKWHHFAAQFDVIAAAILP